MPSRRATPPFLASLAFLLVGLSACAGTPVVPHADAAATIIVVRHAEKSNDDPRDPSLSDAGRARAQRLAARLSEERLVAAYATGYRRTQQTVQPVAHAHGLAVTTYDAAQPADAFAAQLRAAHPEGTVLVAGHSNTVPQIVAALCGCEAAPMTEDEYDRISIVRIDHVGHVSLQVEHGMASTP